MADFIYLLENRLSPPQQAALEKVREVARNKGLTVFLVGGAVRDLIAGSLVRDLDVVVQGNALKLKKDIEKAGGQISGEHEVEQAFYVRFPDAVRMEIGSTLTATYPKPGKPVFKPASILEDLRRRDFTANAMAISLNDGSYGLLMDPLNGVADIENRELRLVNNYGFIEDPVRMVRAVRLMARLGWQMDEKTQERYETGKQEGYISAMDAFHRGYETEEIFHEEDPLRALRRLESEGWMKHLAPGLSASKANAGELEKLRATETKLQLQGIHPEGSVASFSLLTAKVPPKDVTALKKSFPRQGFVAEIAALEGEAKAFLAQFAGKGAAAPSQAWKLLYSSKPEAVLWAAHTSKAAGVQAKFNSFYTDWPQARQKIPYAQMQEMRIVPGVAGYDELLDKLFFELMDNKLGTTEEMKAFLEPYSPPAPPPPVHLRRARMARKEPRPAKSRKKAAAQGAEEAATGEAPAAVEIAATAAPAKPAKAAAKEAKAAEKKTATPVTPAKPAAKQPARKAAAPAKTAPKPAAKKAAAPTKKAAAKAPAKKAAAKKVAVVKKPATKVAAKKSQPKTAAKKPQVKATAKKVPAKKPATKSKAAKKATPAKKKR
jgi:tRNA nucleotidyltransferase/poly(A) polymerase